MAHTLPALPYDVAALEPHIDTQTMTIHHGKNRHRRLRTVTFLITPIGFSSVCFSSVLSVSSVVHRSF